MERRSCWMHNHTWARRCLKIVPMTMDFEGQVCWGGIAMPSFWVGEVDVQRLGRCRGEKRERVEGWGEGMMDVQRREKGRRDGEERQREKGWSGKMIEIFF